MGRKIIILIILLFPTVFYSQVKISGQIRDKENNLIDYIEVLLQNKDSVYIKSELTNADGKFTFEADKGEYTVIVRQMGTIYHSQKIDLEEDIDLEVIQINKKQLSEVVISGQKKIIERKVDRLVFNVENSIASTGGTALDALKATPNIRVQNDKITMIGKSGVGIMIDDKLLQLSGNDLVSFLKTISSENIKSIEVITTPPARYSAEGNSGLVNIKLKKTKNDSWNTSINFAYKQATYATVRIGGNFNYQKNKISIFSNLNSSYGAFAPIETSKIYYPKRLWSNSSQRKDFVKNINGRIGIDYKISKKLSVGIQYLGSNSKPDIDENNLTTITNDLNEINYYIKTKANSNKKNNSNSLNLHTTYEIDTIGTKISTDFDWFIYNYEDDRVFKSNFLDPFGNIMPNTYISANDKVKNSFSNYSGNIDVEMPLKLVNLSYGGKISKSKNNSYVAYIDLSNGTPESDESQNNKFDYEENTVALYFSGTREISKKLQTQIGLRMESTNTNGFSYNLNQENKNNYIKIFPTGYITYKHNENNVFSLSYSNRINRPPFFSLNPFRWYSNPFFYSEGNPFLQPSFSNNLEFVYSHKQNWENRIYFSKNSNGFSQILFVDYDTNIQAIQFSNLYNISTIGLSESYIFDKLKFWESYNSLDLSYSNTTSLLSFTNQNRIGINTFFSSNNTFFINKQKTIILNLNFWLSPSGVSDLDKRTAYNQLDLALKFLLLNKDLQLSFIVNDLTSSNRPTYMSYSNNLLNEYRNYYDDRFFRISVTYKFGIKNVNVKKRGLGNDEEVGRTN